MVSHKAALERLWKDRCSVFVQDKRTDPSTKVTDFVEKPLFQDQPCKLSFETLTSTNGDNTAALTQSVKLFLSNSVTVPPGSKIIVTRPTGTVQTYSNSGEPGEFTFHQEIQLELFKGWT